MQAASMGADIGIGIAINATAGKHGAEGGIGIAINATPGNHGADIGIGTGMLRHSHKHRRLQKHGADINIGIGIAISATAGKHCAGIGTGIMPASPSNIDSLAIMIDISVGKHSAGNPLDEPKLSRSSPEVLTYTSLG